MTIQLDPMRLADAERRLLAGVPVRRRQLTLAGIETPVLEGGSGTPLVLLHGPGGGAVHWWRVLPALTRRHRVIAPDLPGQGAPLPAGAELDAPLVLRWLAELVDATCPAPPALAGQALGGAIAARFAATEPGRLGRLVLVDALGLAPFAPAPAFRMALQAFAEDPEEATHEALWQRCAHDLPRLQAAIGGPWAAFVAANLARARTAHARAALGAMMEQFAFRAMPPAELARIAAPTALVWGRHDLATPLAVAAAVSARRNWPLHVIDGAADDPPVERPEAFARTLRAVIDGPGDLGALRRRTAGAVLVPGAAGFDASTDLWNGAAGSTPALVVQPTGADDVVAALDHARAHDLAVTVRGRGHHIGGAALAAGGLTLDMALLRSVEVDPEARTATVGPGCALAEVDAATQRHGLATPLGYVSGVGVAGLTLGGGLGYLSRRFGWTVDNLLEVEIVTPDGCVRHASRDREPELFWGVRGAGAHLGVVTSFTFRLHPVGPLVFGGLIAWPFARAAEVLRAYRELTTAAPRELSTFLVMLRAPSAPFVPAAARGERVCALLVCHSGAAAERAGALAPLEALGDPVIDLLAERPYTELQSLVDADEPRGDHYYWKTEFLAELTDELLEVMRDTFATCPLPGAEIGLLQLGGAIADRAADDGAVGNRDARYVAGANGHWGPGAPDPDANRRWVRAAWERFRPFGTGATYVNFQGADEGAERRAEAYGPNLARLRELKRRFDPDGRLRPLG